MNLPPTKPTPPPPNPATTTTTTALKGECSNCGIKDRWLLHRVLLRGADRRLCTSCVLRLHPSSFCPSCFEFFEHPLSATSSAAAHRFISCVKCSSLTHLRCLPSPSPPPSSFLCPPCSTPNFSFFPIPNPNANHVLDQKLALVFLCAAKIASASAARAFGMARARADRTVREAAAARKRAKEALERVDKVKLVEGSIEVSGSRNLGSNQKVMCKKEELNGHNMIKVPSEVLPLPQNALSVAVKNNNGAPHSVVRGNGNAIVKDKPANDEDLERVQSCHGRIVDVS